MEAILIQNTSAKSFSYVFLQWISIFDIALYVFKIDSLNLRRNSLKNYSLIGLHCIRTAVYHSESNCLVERFLLSLKSSIIFRIEDWVFSLLIVLFSLCCILNDSGYSAFSAITGKHLHVQQIYVSNPSSWQEFEVFMKKWKSSTSDIYQLLIQQEVFPLYYIYIKDAHMYMYRSIKLRRL